jgi:CIC family chloride channel protein
VVGGLVGGALVLWLAPEAEGHGTDAAIDAYHNHGGVIRARVPLVKTIASAITLGTGGSAGREGPIAQIGAGFGSAMAGMFKLGVRERRMLMIAGMGAGVGAIFRAPLAGALFSAEVLYREMDMEFEVLIPAMISSIVAYSVFTLAFGAESLFLTSAFTFGHPVELIPYTVLALVVAAGARLFVQVFYAVRDGFKALRVPPVVKPMLGGVVVGCIALVVPEAIGSSYGVVQQALNESISLRLLLAVAVFKIAATSFTVGSGQSGGVFGPAIVIGGALGGVVGIIAHRLVPSVSPPAGAFVIVGMAGYFAAAANTPISTIIMVSEMTGSYRLLVPSMWVSMIAFLLVRRSSLYEKQPRSRADSPTHVGEMMSSVLESMTVRDALGDDGHATLSSVATNTCLHDLVELFGKTHHLCFPVLDANGRMLGVVDGRALRQAIAAEADLTHAIVAADLLEDAPRLRISEQLHSAVRKMVSSGHDELVVVEDDDNDELVGMLSRRDLVAAYDHRIQSAMNETGPDAGRILEPPRPSVRASGE